MTCHCQTIYHYLTGQVLLFYIKGSPLANNSKKVIIKAMIRQKIEKNDWLVFSIFASFWVFLGWIGFLSAIGGFFYFWIFLGFFLLIIAVFLRQIILKRISLKISSEFLIISLAILVFVVSSCFFVTPTIFSGRDQGSISEAAIRLSQNHKLEFSTPVSQEFFQIYGPGKALNFPGFYYDQQGNLITQFPLVYISWLAIFFSFFGLSGLIIANAILLFIFLLSFYLIARLFVKIKYAVILLVLTATAFPFFWFFKFTLSENMALTLLWLGIFWILLFLREKNNLYYFSVLVSFGLLIFTRIEGILFFFSGWLTVFFLTKKEMLWKKNRKNLIIYPVIFLAVIFLLNFSKDFYFYKEIAKALLHFGENGNGKSTSLGNIFSPIFFESRIFYLYGMLSFSLLGVLGIIYFFIKKDWRLLVPFFIISPSLIYLFSPWISSDHPWMLRRFVFSIFPAFIFYFLFFLERWIEEKNLPHRKIISWTVMFSALALNLFMFSKYFPFSENKNLLEETKKISRIFSKKDLVLVDQQASQDGWSMIAGPMNFIERKNATYFFNPHDLKKIDRQKFSKIYLIVPEKNIENYSSQMEKESFVYIKDYYFEVERLSTIEDGNSFDLPEKQKYQIMGKIFEIK